MVDRNLAERMQLVRNHGECIVGERLGSSRLVLCGFASGGSGTEGRRRDAEASSRPFEQISQQHRVYIVTSFWKSRVIKVYEFGHKSQGFLRPCQRVVEVLFRHDIFLTDDSFGSYPGGCCEISDKRARRPGTLMKLKLRHSAGVSFSPV
jgi:hypothetical protein